MTEPQRRYAKALFAVCPDEEALRAGTQALFSCPELLSALENPCVPQEEKSAVLDRVLTSVSPELIRFFKLLTQVGRLRLLPGISAALHDLVLAEQNAARGVLRAAFAPSENEAEALAAALAKRHGLTRVELTVETDPTLLGGFVLEVQGVTYDKSILGSLRALARALK